MKRGDGALEIDVVLPKRVVGVDEEGLGRQASSSWLLADSNWNVVHYSKRAMKTREMGAREAKRLG